MGTIIEIEQGGTGVQSVQELKEKVLRLKNAAECEVSDRYSDNSHETVPTSYALSEGLKKIEEQGIVGVVPIEKGGTGASTKEQAIKNLGINETTVHYPIPVEQGGTGGITPESALMNLGVTFPIPVSRGGTGAINKEGFITSVFGVPALPVSYGGTGCTSIDDFKNILDLSFPLPIEKGGTGSTTVRDIRKKLNFAYLNISYVYGRNQQLEDGTEDPETLTDLNSALRPGLYKSVRSLGEVPLISNKPSDKAFTMIVISDEDMYTGMSGRCSQLVIDENNDIYTRFFVRTSGNDGVDQTETWTPWVLLSNSSRTHEWTWETVNNGTRYSPSIDEPSFSDPNIGAYLVFIDGTKLKKTEYSIDFEGNSIQLSTPTQADSELSVTYVG